MFNEDFVHRVTELFAKKNKLPMEKVFCYLSFSNQNFKDCPAGHLYTVRVNASPAQANIQQVIVTGKTMAEIISGLRIAGIL